MLSNFVDQGGVPAWVSNTSTANADVTCVKAADTANCWCIDEIAYSYSGGTVTGRLTIVIGSTTYLDIDIVATGPGQIYFPKGLFDGAVTKNVAATVKLYAGGSGVVGKLNVRFR